MMKSYKASRFSHFFKGEDGKRLAFNAVSCGLATMDDEVYEKYEEIISNSSENIDESDDVVKKLKEGRFLVPGELDEIDWLKVQQHLARFSSRSASMTIAPTLNCNFACTYCYEGRKLSSVMSDEIVDAILRYLDAHLSTERRFSVSWYGGEPLLCLNKIEEIPQGILDICSKKNIKYGAAIITNGYLFTEDVAKKLADLKVRSVQITLDGPEEVHDSRRPLKSGKGTYSVIVENIARASEVYPYRISIRVNIDKRNISSMSEMLHNLKQRGFHLKQNVFLHFATVTAATLGCQDVAPHCFNPKMFSKLELELYEKALDLGFKTMRYPMVNLGICGAVNSNSFVVEPSGALHKCWNTIGDSSKEVGHILRPNEGLTPNLIKWLA